MGDLKNKMPTTTYKEEIDPRRWFVERIRAQAKEEGVEFTPSEQEYLFLTEQAQDEAASNLLDTIKGKGFGELDHKISGLAWRRYESDIKADASAKEEYERALHALANSEQENLNLGMFVNCILLETPPDELDPKPLPRWVLLTVLLAVLAFIVFSYLRR